MSFKFSIGNTLEFRVQAENTSVVPPVRIDFFMRGNRLSQAEFTAAMADNGPSGREFLAGNMTGWRGQRLVVDDMDQPAEFSQPAFEAMCSVLGLERVIFDAYMSALAGTAAPESKKGN